MNRTLNLYSIFYYNMINIQVLLIIQVLIILKHFGDLDFKPILPQASTTQASQISP